MSQTDTDDIISLPSRGSSVVPTGSSKSPPDDTSVDTTRVRTGGGRNGPRSRNGCWTCRTKKVKCDEARPKCLRCIRLRLFCDYEPRERQNAHPTKIPAADHSTSLRKSNSGAASTVLVSQALAAAQPWLMRRSALAGDMSLPRHLPAFDVAANSLRLTSLDHEAIRYYRTTFSSRHETKNTDFSVHSVIFTLAERDMLVMRGLLALGSRSMQLCKVKTIESQKNPETWSGLGHYSAALRMMADTIGTGEERLYLDLDGVLATMYLMILYEQKHGDPSYLGFINHLAGAALVVQQRCSDWPAQLENPPAGRVSMTVPRDKEMLATTKTPPLSIFAARMLIYIMYMDALASAYGIGGQVNRAMYKVLRAHRPNFVLAEAFDRLYQYSNGLYRATWGESYPKEEMLKDVVNKDVFTLITSAVFLRHLVAEISTLKGDAAREELAVVQAAADHLTDKYPEILAIAAEMTPQAEFPETVTLHIGMFTPVFYISLLELHQLQHKLHPGDMTDDEVNATSEAYISIIMNLAQQTYKHVGIEAIHLISHPLFRVAIYTRIEAHRNWVLARFKEMVGFGTYMVRAYAFLLWAIKKEAETGEKVDVRKEFQSPNVEKFMV